MSLFWVLIHRSFHLCLPQKFSCCLTTEKYLTFLQLSIVLQKIVLQYFLHWYLVFWGIYNKNAVKNFDLLVLGSKTETALLFQATSCALLCTTKYIKCQKILAFQMLSFVLLNGILNEPHLHFLIVSLKYYTWFEKTFLPIRTSETCTKVNEKMPF